MAKSPGRRLPRGMFKRGKAYYVRDQRAGRDRRVSLGTGYAEAMRRYSDFIARGMPAPRLTVAAAADRWLETRIAAARNEKGRRMARFWTERYLRPFLGHMLLSKVKQDDLRDYRLWLEGRCRTATTVHHILRDARCLFLWAEESGLIDRAPVPKRLLPRLQERPPDRLTDDEVSKMLAVPEPWAFVIRLGLGTGLRWAELCRAQASDVQDGMLVVHQTKSGRVRRVPLSPDLLRELRSRIGRLVPYSVESPGSFANIIRRHSGVRRFHVHQLRHTMACKWLEASGSLAALQEILGHASIVTTQRYARISTDMVKREAERIAGGAAERG